MASVTRAKKDTSRDGRDQDNRLNVSVLSSHRSSHGTKMTEDSVFLHLSTSVSSTMTSSAELPGPTTRLGSSDPFTATDSLVGTLTPAQEPPLHFDRSASPDSPHHTNAEAPAVAVGDSLHLIDVTEVEYVSGDSDGDSDSVSDHGRASRTAMDGMSSGDGASELDQPLQTAPVVVNESYVVDYLHDDVVQHLWGKLCDVRRRMNVANPS